MRKLNWSKLQIGGVSRANQFLNFETKCLTSPSLFIARARAAAAKKVAKKAAPKKVSKAKKAAPKKAAKKAPAKKVAKKGGKKKWLDQRLSFNSSWVRFPSRSFNKMKNSNQVSLILAFGLSISLLSILYR